MPDRSMRTAICAWMMMAASAANAAPIAGVADCDAPECGCAFLTDVRAPLHSHTRVTSIYSSEDPIVPKSACRVPGAANHEITGTHSGLAYNVEALRLIAAALAQR